ncbi:unnamed protein product, partial [Rotaria sp. Silwood2]
MSFLLLFKVLYLLSVREHGDPHLRGACANLLAKLIQTTIHLLTLLSLSNSFNDSFINFQTSIRIQVGCLEDINVLSNVLRPTTIRSFFLHNQYDELRLLIHFLKNPFT